MSTLCSVYFQRLTISLINQGCTKNLSSQFQFLLLPSSLTISLWSNILNRNVYCYLLSLLQFQLFIAISPLIHIFPLLSENLLRTIILRTFPASSHRECAIVLLRWLPVPDRTSGIWRVITVPWHFFTLLMHFRLFSYIFHFNVFAFVVLAMQCAHRLNFLLWRTPGVRFRCCWPMQLLQLCVLLSHYYSNPLSFHFPFYSKLKWTFYHCIISSLQLKSVALDGGCKRKPRINWIDRLQCASILRKSPLEDSCEVPRCHCTRHIIPAGNILSVWGFPMCRTIRSSTQFCGYGILLLLFCFQEGLCIWSIFLLVSICRLNSWVICILNGIVLGLLHIPRPRRRVYIPWEHVKGSIEIVFWIPSSSMINVCGSTATVHNVPIVQGHNLEHGSVASLSAAFIVSAGPSV